jgi:hypothetical protein
MKKLINISFVVLLSFLNFSIAQAQEYELKDKDFNSKNELYYIEPADNWKNATDNELFKILGQIHRLNTIPQYTFNEVITEGTVEVKKYVQTYNQTILVGSDLIVRRVGGEIRSVIGVPREVKPGSSLLPSDSILISTAKEFLGEKRYLYEDSSLIARK